MSQGNNPDGIEREALDVLRRLGDYDFPANVDDALWNIVRDAVRVLEEARRADALGCRRFGTHLRGAVDSPPSGMEWEHREGLDGGGFYSEKESEAWPSTLYRRAVGPWRVVRQGGRHS